MSTDPRTARTRSRTLDAAFQLLGEEGLESTTVERIAECAGVHKTTVYRHWPEREDLLADALEANMDPAPIHDSGDVRNDLVAAMTGLARTISTPPWSVLLPSLIAASTRDERLAGLHRQFTERRRQATVELVERAKARGELSAHLDAGHLVETLAGAVVYRQLMLHERSDRSYIEHHVDHVLRAAR
ncbi:MAG: TetR/AcrR family transcriptional regulator [Actinomycetes bacterium]